MPSINILIGNEEHLALLLPHAEKKQDIHSTIHALFNTYANLSAVVITYREGATASAVTVGAAAATREKEVSMAFQWRCRISLTVLVQGMLLLQGLSIH